jgi:hypothetical protein
MTYLQWRDSAAGQSQYLAEAIALAIFIEALLVAVASWIL